MPPSDNGNKFKRTPPEFLYKYRAFDAYNESWICKDEIYCPSPRKFNDPFDCKANLCFDATPEEFKRFILRRNIFQGMNYQTKQRAIEALNDGRLITKVPLHSTGISSKRQSTSMECVHFQKRVTVF